MAQAIQPAAGIKPRPERREGRGRRREFTGADGSDQYDHEVLDVARVVRVVKGGRRFRFRASVIVGDRAGRVGFGIGKSRDIQQALQKAQNQATKNVISIPIENGTIPHQTEAKYKGAQVFLKPAKPGTGLIAGGTVRAVADLAGITDLVAKRHGSANKLTNAVATLNALQALRK